MNPTRTDYVGQIGPWLARYDTLTATHAHRLSEFEGDETREGYGDTRFSNSLEAEGFLAQLATHLRTLVGEPPPGTAHTLSFAGVNRHDGEGEFYFVANGTDLRDAARTLLTLPGFHYWISEQATYLPDDERDDSAPVDVLYLPDKSHPGVTGFPHDDLRSEEAAPVFAPGNVPALPLSILG
ncbi:hypothetical protein ABZ905_32130 [Streptomyces parvus]|uniref:hypothetical protein n=1 Tax=Streptomyces parvus TaxID=66428 RepID=UPI0033E41382